MLYGGMDEIRKAKIEDLPLLHEYQRQLYGEYFDDHHADLSRAVALGRVWVAAETDVVIGYQLCELFDSNEPNFPNSIFLSELFVIPNRRSEGIGSRLVEAALTENWPEEFKYFSLTHDPAESQLTKFYEKFGFKGCGKTAVGNIKMTRPR